MSAGVPVMIHLDGDTFRRLERIAERKGVRMADMIAAGLARSVTPKPQVKGGQVPAPVRDDGMRGYRRLTAEEWAELDRLRAEDWRVRNLAARFGISSSTIYQRDRRERKRVGL
jgi:transcriptional regulator of acetoin/glycerol metabolism